jgi:dTMP kinase
MSRHGVFISFEGGDGSGKSTQLRRLAEGLRAEGRDVVETREPGGSPGAEEIRPLLLGGDPDRWSAETEALLFTAARRDHLEKTIQPALDRGGIVLCDRFADSTRVYQGVARAANRELVDKLHALMIEVEPDLTLIFDIATDTALARGLARDSGEDRFEEFGLSFQDAIRQGYRALAAEFPHRCVLVNAEGTADDVAARVRAAIDRVLP